MGLSFWQLLILLLFGIVYVVPVFAADRTKRLARKPFILRTLGLMLVVLLLSIVASALGDIAALVGFIFGILSIVLLVLWSVHRTQDIGWSRWWCLLFIVPLAGGIYWLILLFKRGQPSTAEPDIETVFS